MSTATLPHPPPRPRANAWQRGLALLLLAWGAKVILLALVTWDGGAQAWASPWAPLAFLHEDVWLAAGISVLAAVAGRLPGRASRAASRAGAVGFVVLGFWIGFNVPVARVMSSPATYGLLHATGNALGDSFAHYLTPVNLGVPMLIVATSVVLWRRPPPAPRTSRGRLLLVLASAAIVAVGPRTVARTETLGRHRNAVLALLQTTFGHAAASDGEFHLPPCAPDPDSPSTDLRDLAGVAAGRNVLWVLLESTAARFLTPHGADRDVTPHLSALARTAVIFDHAYAAYPESIKGLFSMLCSRTPPPGTEASQYTPERYPCPAIAGELERAGFATGLFHSGRFLYLGMDSVVAGRGFGSLHDAATIPSAHTSSFGVDDRATARKVLAFIDGLPKGARFFAVYMPIAGHHPYHAPGDGPRPLPETSDKDAYLNDLFVGDDAFGLLRAGLVERGLDDKTLYVVAGDHGEAFREHEGNIAHALALYEENLHVPLWIAAPGRFSTPRRASQLASLIDLGPTTLDLLGLAAPERYEGRSLLPPGPRVVRFFTEQAVVHAGLRDGRWKFLAEPQTGRARLFDLEADPGETIDRAAQHPDRVARYRSCLE